MGLRDEILEIVRAEPGLYADESIPSLDLDSQSSGRPTGWGSAKHASDALCSQVTVWIERDVAEEDIGIATRTKTPLDTVADALRNAGVQSLKMDQSLPTGDGVRLGNMHRLEGLEFRCVAIVDCDDNSIPLSLALTDPSADQVQHAQDIRQERCLLYVAATRVRDDLWVGWSGRPSRFIEPMVGES